MWLIQINIISSSLIVKKELEVKHYFLSRQRKRLERRRKQKLGEESFENQNESTFIQTLHIPLHVTCPA
jgi:hypothetical protein